MRKMSSLIGLSKRLNIIINKNDDRQAFILENMNKEKYEIIKPYTKDNQIIVFSKKMREYDGIYYSYVKRGINNDNIKNVISIVGEDDNDKKYIYNVYNINNSMPTYYYQKPIPLVPNIYCPKHFIMIDNEFEVEKFKQDIKYFNHFNNAHYYLIINRAKDNEKALGNLRSLKTTEYNIGNKGMNFLELLAECAFNDLNREYRG